MSNLTIGFVGEVLNPTKATGPLIRTDLGFCEGNVKAGREN
jgi:hypothetical protein